MKTQAKPLRTNSKAVRDKIKAHILECVYDEEENTFVSLAGACKHLWKEFERVAEHPLNMRRMPSQFERFSDYLMGLPFHFEYETHKVEFFLNGLSINPDLKEYSAERMFHLYHWLIFRETCKAS